MLNWKENKKNIWHINGPFHQRETNKLSLNNFGKKIKNIVYSALTSSKSFLPDLNSEHEADLSRSVSMGLSSPDNVFSLGNNLAHFNSLMSLYKDNFSSLPLEQHNVLPDLLQPNSVSYSQPALQLKTISKNYDYTLCNIFWRPALTFHPYQYGDIFVPFETLWPEGDYLNTIILEFVNNSISLKIIEDLCLFVLRCGPLRVLRKLIEFKLIDMNHIFENTYSMLHVACISQNFEVVHFLISSGISYRIEDVKGRLAEHVCYNAHCLKALNLKNTTSSLKRKSHKILTSVQREKIFQLSKSIEYFEELLLLLQAYIFNVNDEYDSNGDNLLHIAVFGGLSMLALTITLIKNYKANIEVLNSKGETPLIIAVIQGNVIMAEILICVFGADPNICNPFNGWTSLHYASYYNHEDAVSCLIKRGADTNLENCDGLWPDDISESNSTNCKNIIQSARQSRSEKLQHLVEHSTFKPDEIRKSDLFIINEDGATLIMTAAIKNKCDALKILLEISGAPINAQHKKSGQTALSLVAAIGHAEATRLLLRFNADPSIKDIEGMLPLHHAVLRNYQSIIEVLLDDSRCWLELKTAIQISKSVPIIELLQEAFQKRQKEIVAPLLFECSITNNADKLYAVLENGDDINPVSGVGDWPMYLAVSNGHLAVAKLLYEYGGDIWSQHIANQNTVLHMACMQGHTSMVQFLLENAENHSHPYGQKLDVNAFNSQRTTALALAADKGYSHIVKMLMLHGASSAFLDSNGNLYSCPAYQGVQVFIETHQRMRTDLIMYYIRDKKGLKKLNDIWMDRFDHNLRDRKGNTPLMVACRCAKIEIINLLLQSAIQDLDPNKYKSCRIAYDDRFSEADTESSLMTEASSIPIKSNCLNYLIDGSFKKKSSPHLAVKFNIDDLLSASQTDNLNTHIYEKKVLRKPSSDHIAPEKQTFEESWRWGKGIIAPWKNSFAESYDHERSPWSIYEIPGFFSTWGQGNKSIFTKDTINHLCAVNSIDGSNVLHHAVVRDNMDVLEMLLDKDQSYLNMQDKQGLSALHLACKLGHRKIVNKLLSLPYIDPDLRTLDGKLPEEMTKKKSILKSFQAVRGQESSGLFASILGRPTSTVVQGSTVDFEKINARFTLLQQGIESESTLEESYSS